MGIHNKIDRAASSSNPMQCALPHESKLGEPEGLGEGETTGGGILLSLSL